MAEDFHRIDDRITGILESLEVMAGGDFTVRNSVSSRRDEIDAIAYGINILADEFQFNLEQLKSAQAQLIQSGKMAAVGLVCAGLAHEINNPLTIINGYFNHIGSVLSEKGIISSEEAQPYLEKIQHSVERVADIIKRVKDFSRESSHDMEDVDLYAVLNNSLALFGQQFHLKKIHLMVKYPAEKIFVTADKGRLEQVFVNIVSNSIYALKSVGERQLGVDVSSMGHSVIIVFFDNGEGIEAELTERVFDPFFTTKPLGEGTGLGLSISHGIIKGHGGTIDFESEKDKGTRVTIKLPIKQKK